MSGSRGDTSPQVAVIIVNYNGRDDTLECLASLQKLTYPNYSTLVVDQASGDGTVEVIFVSFPSVTVLASPVNDGFAGGNNRGAAWALADGADYLFLLNNDTKVSPDLLEPLVAHAEASPTVGIVGPRMLYYDHPDVIWSDGGRIAARGDSQMIDQGRKLKAAEPDETLDAAFPVGFVVGCGMLIRRAVWEALGGMDGAYFLYYEEADFCARARRLGWGSVTVPQSRLWHKVSRSTGGDSDQTLYYMRRNVLRYLRRCVRCPLLAVARSAADTLYLATVFLLRGPRRRARILVWALMDSARGRWGKSERF